MSPHFVVDDLTGVSELETAWNRADNKQFSEIMTTHHTDAVT